MSPRAKPKVVHYNRLWKYSGASPPTWFGDNVGSLSVQTEPVPSPDSERLVGGSEEEPEDAEDQQPKRRYPLRMRRQVQPFGT